MDAAGPPRSIDEMLRHEVWLRRLAAALLRDDRADDAVQETWLAVLRGAPRDVKSPRGWLRRVLVRQVGRRLRGDATRRSHEHAAPERPATPASEELVARAELHQRVARAVLALEEPYRTTVLLRFFEGLSPRDVAAEMSVPLDTVRTRIRRALARIRRALEDESGGRWRALLVPWIASPKQGRRAPLRLASAAGGGGVPVGMTAKSSVAAAALVLAALLLVRREGGADTTAAAARHDPAQFEARNRAPRSAGPGTLAGPEPALARREPAPDEVVVTVRVRTPDGAPIAGARVEAVRVPAESLCGDAFGAVARLGAASAAGAATVTDERGEARLGVGAERTWTVRATAPGRCTSGRTAMTYRRGEVPETVVLTLAEGHELHGTVRDGRGAPLAGARVLGHRGGFSFDEHAWSLRSETVSDAAGRFALTGLAAGKFELFAAPPGRLARQRGWVRVPAVADVDLVLESGGVVEGRVTDADTGAAVAGASLLLVADAETGWYASARVRTGTDGRYRTDEFPACVLVTRRTQIEREGWVVDDDPSQATDELGVAPGVATRYDIRVRRAATLRGVVTADGAPVARARVRVHFASAEWAVWRTAETDARGRYEFTGLPAQRVRVDVAAAGLRQDAGPDGSAQVDVPRAGEVTLDVRLVPGDAAPATTTPSAAAREAVAPSARRTVAVRLLADEDAAPVAGARVVLVSDAAQRRCDWLLEGVADREGYARVDVRDGESGGLYAVAPGRRPEPLGRVEGESVSVRLRLARPLAGHARLADGTPAAHASIEALSPAGSVLARTIAGPDGAFRLDTGEPGEARIELRLATSPERVAASVDGVREGTDDLLLVAAAAPTLRGSLVGPDGGGVAGVPVALAGETEFRVERVTDATGSFAFEGVPDAGLRLRVLENAEGWVAPPLDGVRASETPVRVRATQGLTIRGLLVDEAGRDVSEIEIEAVGRATDGTPLGASWGTYGVSRTDARGAFRCGPLLPGEYDVRLSAEGDDRAPRPHALSAAPRVAAGASRVELRLVAGATIQGSVAFLGARPLEPEGGLVRATPVDASLPVRFARLRADATFEVAGLVPGAAYVLHAQVDGFAHVATSPRTAGDSGLRIEAGRGESVEARLVDAAGHPLPGRRVRLVGPDPSVEANATTGDDGALIVRGLPPGRLSVEVEERLRGTSVEAWTYRRVGELEAGAPRADLVVEPR